MMPQMSGIELAIKLKEACPKCKVLLFSGQADTADLLYDSRQQGHDFKLLAKPVHPSVFLERVRIKEQRLAEECCD
jgi:FixJ family two-component response regulator